MVTRGGRSHRIAVRGPIDPESPTRVRWRSPRELLIEQHVDRPGEKPGTRISLLSRDGALLEVLSDREGLSDGEPSPDGRWLALGRDYGGVTGSLQIRDLDRGFALRAAHPEPDALPLFRFGTKLIWGPGGARGWLIVGGTHIVWNPDGTRLALASRVPTSVAEHDRADAYAAPAALVARDHPGYELLRAHVPGKPSAGPSGFVPLFWVEGGIYGRSFDGEHGLLRCDPAGSGCTSVYALGKLHLIVDGRPAGERTALLLVYRLDLWRPGRTELHRVDLATGRGRVVFRFPQGYASFNFDWSPDPAAE